VSESVVYFVGDVGTPSQELEQVASAIAAELLKDEGPDRSRTEPILVALGDNLYPKGLPTPGAEAKHPEPRERLRELARVFARCRFRGRPAVVVLVPGNHDYGGEALSARRSLGDITRWYYLDELGIEGLDRWVVLPGARPPDVTTSGELYARVYQNAQTLAAFMKPRKVPGLGRSLNLVAIDSELLIDLFRTRSEDLVQDYLEGLRMALAEPSSEWRAVVAHHPLETFGKHRPAVPGRFLLGPGWPQFPQWWHKVVAPIGPLVTFGYWLTHHTQDVHSRPYREYRSALLELLAAEGVPLFVAGHDHNTQLIELPGSVVQLVSGEATHLDPVTKGKGSFFYHMDHGFVRMSAFSHQLFIEVKNSHGETVFGYGLDRR
jgi:hypothetical protein